MGMSTNIWIQNQKVGWQCPATFCLYTFPAHNLNSHWRWRWWHRIRAIFSNFFYLKRTFLLEKKFFTWKEMNFDIRTGNSITGSFSLCEGLKTEKGKCLSTKKIFQTTYHCRLPSVDWARKIQTLQTQFYFKPGLWQVFLSSHQKQCKVGIKLLKKS